MRISSESHEILMSFQFSWEKWDSHEQKTSWEILMRIGKFSWECHFLMRISWDSHENSKTHENFCKGTGSTLPINPEPIFYTEADDLKCHTCLWFTKNKLAFLSVTMAFTATVRPCERHSVFCALAFQTKQLCAPMYRGEVADFSAPLT